MYSVGDEFLRIVWCEAGGGEMQIAFDQHLDNDSLDAG